MIHGHHRAVMRLLACTVGTLAVLHTLSAVATDDPLPKQPPLTAADRTTLSREVESVLKAHGDGIEASLWLGGESGDAWFEVKSNRFRPAASAIKTFFLVELFDANKGKLDEPLPGGDGVLKDDEHPAISHFSAEDRQRIRAALRGASVRQVADVMMGKTKEPNSVYNAAA